VREYSSEYVVDAAENEGGEREDIGEMGQSSSGRVLDFATKHEERPSMLIRGRRQPTFNNFNVDIQCSWQLDVKCSQDVTLLWE